MGCCVSTEIDDYNFQRQAQLNDAIDRSIIKLYQNKSIKILLLGTGESGKSTVLKQMKLLHKGGFSDEEKLQYVQVIWTDALQSMRTLIVNARRLNISLDCDEVDSGLMAYRNIILSVNPEKALEMIDVNAAGGKDFIADYLLKYSTRGERQRRGGHNKSIPNWDNSNIQVDELLGSDDDASTLLDGKPQLTTGFYNTSKISNSTNGNGTNPTKIQLAKAINMLWKGDRGIKQCLARSNEFQLSENAAYYFDNIERYSEAGCKLNDEDILRGRVKTTGINETSFLINGMTVTLIDVGGQRSERKKWLHCFNDINMVLFVVAISEYDQKLFEDQNINRMHESLHLFDSIVNSPIFHRTPFMLFMNKKDLFEKKIISSPIRHYFPSYEGKIGDYTAGEKYFQNLFLSRNKTNKPIYVHSTCATDTTQMDSVLAAVTDMITRESLKMSGLL